MSQNTLGIQVHTEIPKTFIRGQDLEFVMELPCDVPKNYFHNSTTNPSTSTTTAITSTLRKLENAGVDGLIANLDVSWEPNTDYSKIRFKATNTDNWPIGPAEFDVVFVRTTVDNTLNQTTSKKFRSLPVRITIADGVTA